MADLYEGLQLAPQQPPAPKAPPGMYEGLQEVAPTNAAVREPVGFLEHVEAGLQASAIGLAYRRKLPDLVMNPETSRWWERLATGVAGVGADLPIMIPAGAKGAALGAAVAGPVGAIVGGGSAMFAAPAGIRTSLMEVYKAQAGQTPYDWFNIVRETAKAMVHEGAVGAVTFGAGAAARGAFAATMGATSQAATAVGLGTATMATRGAARAAGATDVAAQIAAMVTFPAALDGRLPEAREFVDAAGVILTLKGAHMGLERMGALKTTAQRIANVYERTGKTPAEQVADAQADVKVADELARGPAPDVPREPDGRVAMPSIQESLFRDQARLSALEEKAGGTPTRTVTDDFGQLITIEGRPAEYLTDAERVERQALKARVAELEARLAAGEPPVAPAEAPPEAVLAPEGAARARTMAEARLAELEGKAASQSLADAERAERVFLKNNLERPEALGRHFGIAAEAPVRITLEAREASAQRVYDDVLGQVRAADQARKDAGLDPLGDDHAMAVAALVRARVRTRAERLGMLPEDVYRERPLQVQDASAVELARVEAEAPPEAPRYELPEVDLFGEPIAAPVVPRLAVEGMATVELPLANLVLSKEVPQFKAAANVEGVVVPLGGRFDRTGVGPIQVWERLNGAMEVISGRHRLDLARRSGETTIPAQIHREAEGFDVRKAATLDAQLNIREEQGSVADYAQYFKDAGLSKEAADELGLLARAKGRTGYAIARDASGDLLAAHRAGLLSDEAALAVSAAAPGSERLQALGVSMVQDGKSILVAVNTMKAVDLMAAERMAKGAQGDIFGFDDSAMREASAMAKAASSRQRKIGEQIAAVSGASKRPEIAKKMGVNVEDPVAVRAKIIELRQEQELWDNWPLHPELVQQLREMAKPGGVTGREGDLKQGPLDAFELKPETPAELEARNLEADNQAKRKLSAEAAAERAARGLPPRVDQADLFNTQGTLFQDVAKGPLWYSELERQIDAAKMKQAPAQGWKELLKGLKGVRAEEIKWSGIEEWLDLQPGKVSKEDVTAFLRQNGVKVTEKMAGGAGEKNISDKEISRERQELEKRGIGIEVDPEDPSNVAFHDRETGDIVDAATLERWAHDDPTLQLAAIAATNVERYWAGSKDAPSTKFGQYQLPGGENYRELKLTLPATEAVNYTFEQVRTRARELAVASGENYETLGPNGRDRFDQLALREFQRVPGPEFRSTHFDEPNILAHVRFNERTDAEGKRVLFVEEIQSDWAQKGKKEGFADAERLKAVQARLAEMRQLPAQGKWTPELEREETALIMERDKLQEQKIPAAPFVGKTDAWVALTLKRMIRYAAENGFDRVAWTTGEQQVSRYTEALRKAVDSIEWTKTKDGVQLVGYKHEGRPGGGQGAPGESRGRRNKVVDTTEREDALSDAVGKSMADRIRNDPAQTGTIEGENLKIDDTGMAAFYDRIVPNVAKDVLKKLGGGKIGDLRIDEGVGEKGIQEFERRFFRDEGRLPTHDELDGYFPTLSQPGFDITPKLREKALQGMPLFQQHRGSYQVAENLITIMQGADKSTVVHELTHSWLEEMKIDAARPDAPAQLKADWEILRRELAIPESGEISRASHEQFARSGERYLGEGQAPSIELRGVFERFKQWLLDIYRELKNLNVEINPDLRGVLDRMLATDQEIADARALDVPRAYVPEAKADLAARVVTPPGEKKAPEPGFVDEKLAMEPFAEELQAGPGSGPTRDSRVNAQYINGPLDLKLAIQQVANLDQQNIQARRGGKDGVKSWEQANAEADKLGEDILGGKIVLETEGNIPHDIKQRAAFKVMNAVVKHSLKLRDEVLQKGDNATVQDQFDYLQSIVRMRMAHAEFLGLRAAAARAMNQIRDMTPESGVVDKMVEITAGAPRSPAELFQAAARNAAEEAAALKLRLDAIMAQHFGGKSALDIARLHADIKDLKAQLVFAKGVTDATKWDMVVEAWKASLLSGPVTHTVNIFGTESFQFMRPPVDVLAAMIGMARGASPGMGESSRASMSEAVARLTGMMSGIQDGLKLAAANFRADEATQKTESYREAIPGRAGELIRIPLRLMGAEDVLVKTMYERGELSGLAIRKAFDEGLNPLTREFAERVTALKDAPTEEMAAAASQAAVRMTFNAPLGEKGVALQLFVTKWNLQWMLPFIRTPINITKEVARMSPFAPMVGEWRADIRQGGAARDRAIAEVVLGSGIMALTMAYAFAGQITGSGSPDPGKQRGKAGVEQPVSIRIGDKWYEYGRIEPIGTLMNLSADMSLAWDHMTEEEKDKLPKILARAFANAVTNKTFLEGITNVIEAMSDPTRFAPRFIQRMAGSLVPNIIGQPTAMADPVVREVNSSLEAIMARIPGFRQQLLPKPDWLGQPIPTKERIGVIGPVRIQPVSEDKVRLEAARLGISMASPPKKTHVGKGTGKLGDVDLTPEETNTFARVGGEMAHRILGNIVASPGYDQIPDLVKRSIFSKVLTAAHRVAAVAALTPEKRQAYLQTITERVQAELTPAGAE